MSMAESECDVKYRRVEVAPHISQGAMTVRISLVSLAGRTEAY